jgi:type II secretory pathway predicted ATPase ExeA
MSRYKHFFGFQGEPFSQEIKVDNLYPLPGLKALADRFRYALDLGAMSVITGEVGTGKSTSLRYASSALHPSEYRILPVTANTGTILELLKQILLSLQIESRSLSITLLTKTLRGGISDITSKKQKPVLIIDEAHLMRIEVFGQIHTLLQFDFDSKPLVPLILCGQNTLLDKLMYHSSRPLASRIVGRSHLEGLSLKEMEGYLNHHLKIAGVKEHLFAEEAILAIQQGSGGLLRRANHLARGALVAAALEKNCTVSAEHVRAASTEII